MKTRAIVGLAMAGLVSVTPLAQACTRAMWSNDAGDLVMVGRSQDWTEKVDSKFRKFPRGEQRTGHVEGKSVDWTSRYGSLSLIGYDIGTHEGVNEKGLSTHILFLADEASDFGKRDEDRPGLSISLWAQYVLDNFATVSEAVNAIQNSDMQIVPLTLPNGRPSQFHLTLEDKSGDSAIIEYVNGEPKIYHDSDYNVVTNEPTYDKQLENLKSYRGFGGDKALPGERLPMDRFVRASYYTQALPDTEDADLGAAYVLSVMRNVSVPFGAAEPDRPNVANTIFRSVMDLTDQRYYFESTYAPNVVWVDYGELDFSKGSGETELAVEQQIHALMGDVTDRMSDASQPVAWAVGGES